MGFKFTYNLLQLRTGAISFGRSYLVALIQRAEVRLELWLKPSFRAYLANKIIVSNYLVSIIRYGGKNLCFVSVFKDVMASRSLNLQYSDPDDSLD